MLRIGKTIFGLIALTILLGSCWSKKNDLGHDIPSQLVCRFTEGVFTEPADNSINVSPTAFFSKDTVSIHHMVSNAFGSFVALPGSQKPKLKKGVWYKMEIYLFDQENNRLNPQFFQPDQIEIHQFFFNLISNGTEVPKGITYYYSDVINGQLLETPVGFTGYIRVNKDMEAPELRLMLVHLKTGNKYEADGKPNPFDKPSPRVLEFGDFAAFIGIEIKK